MIKWLLSQPIILAGLTALLVGGPAYLAGQFIGARQERSQAELRNTKAIIKQLHERGIINEAINNADIIDICIELGGLPDDCRNQ